MKIVTRVYFRRIAVVGRERFPRRGAVLLVCNHPAAWTDVVVLDVALDRKLHFVAHEDLFRPWIRGLAMRLYSALPVRPGDEGPHSLARNRRTFDVGHALLGRGEVIAFFAEGVSGSDREIGPLRTGAARLALEHVAGGLEPPLILPVALYYEDRTAFRSRVDVAVGEPIPIVSSTDPEDAAHALTGWLARELEASLAAAAAHARVGPPQFTSGPTFARRLLEAAVAPLALAGRVLHFAPVWATETLARRVGAEPQRLAFTRMLAGLVLVPLWYVGLAAVAQALGGGGWFAVPLLAPALGAFACIKIDQQHSRAAVARTAEAKST